MTTSPSEPDPKPPRRTSRLIGKKVVHDLPESVRKKQIQTAKPVGMPLLHPGEGPITKKAPPAHPDSDSGSNDAPS
ncbi:hypothetical protein Pla108_10310 [Botrimarina colliarenosi]|uniref:Uncharacterized protein n=1 Tax=Botrimarina colliarenosi TaxID=2528001 RepID=A0A5C6AKV0_9BACT|nr:hypothetical protein [Botrimarina colliarenosi]TWU00087.1 hypothetical protein Pla108_10310 [Botrimarina colliarenosi]